MRKQFSILPNLLTAGNLVCGFVATIFAVNDALRLGMYNDFFRPFVFSSWLILAAMIFDLLDGIVARLTKTDSQFGKELDSLADLTSFGIAPAVILYLAVLRYHGNIGLLIAAVFAVCSALRLARFNSMPKTDLKNFTGLPTPAAAGVLVSYVIFSHWGDWYYTSKPLLFLDKVGWYAENVTKFNTIFIPVLMVLLAVLMVSNVKFISLKSYVKKEKAPFIAVVMVVVTVLIVIVKPEPSFFAITLGYIAFSLARAIFLEFKGESKSLSSRGKRLPH